MSDDEKKTTPCGQMTGGEIVFRFAVCTVVYQIFFIAFIATLISLPRPPLPGVLFFGVSLILAWATMRHLDPTMAPKLRERQPKSFSIIFWIFLALNIAGMWWMTIGMLGLVEDDGNHYRHPVLDSVMNVMSFPAILLPGWESYDSETSTMSIGAWQEYSMIGGILNSLLWGVLLGPGGCWVFRRWTALKNHGQA